MPGLFGLTGKGRSHCSIHGVKKSLDIPVSEPRSYWNFHLWHNKAFTLSLLSIYKVKIPRLKVSGSLKTS